MSQIPVLVILSTGKQGKEVCNSLLATKTFKVFGTTRKVPSPSLEKKGVTAIEFDFNNPRSIESAIKNTGVQYVWFATDYFIAAKGSKEKEIAHGKAVIDACKAAGIKFVVFSSALSVNTSPENVHHLRSKWEIEKYLAQSGVPHTIIRPAAFMDNFNDPANYNPLKKGKVSGLWIPQANVPCIACRDIGKCSEVILSNPNQYAGQTIEVASGYYTGEQIAAGLTKATGTPSVYQVAVPKCIQALFMSDLHHMCQWFETNTLNFSTAPFLKMVPDAWTFEKYFASLGQYANGEKFQNAAANGK